ncbi:MAG: glucose 1-dehydrogenase [Deltaproteobacteria bacterium]|nr:glucose 1-dehydrogenase [Deltaproteobacteria bacterium]
MQPKLFDLTGKRAVVTGAGRGIGKALALGLADAGADVALISRTMSELDDIAETIRATGRQAEPVSADLADIDRIPDLVKDIEDRLGGIDILVNNAGTNIPTDLVDITPDIWDRIIDLNMKSLFFLSQAVGKLMIHRGQGGRIINISSQAGSAALAKRSVYCASKAGVNLMTKCMALEWAPHDILVNAVAPTFTVTEMTKKFMENPEYLDFALARNLLGRMGQPEDFVGAVIYLAAPASSLVTGHVLMVDAGWTA